MAAPSAYLTKANTVGPILDAIKKAGVPERFTYDFLSKQLGFTSSSDRPVISVLKALRFLDDNGSPLDRYRRYRDPSQSGRVLAEALRDAYADIFAGDQNAQALTTNQLKGVFARIAGKGDAVSAKMAATFKSLADLADFDAPAGPPQEDGASDAEPPPDKHPAENESVALDRGDVVLRHDVHVHLPVSTGIAVYDAIFRSLRENLAL